MTVLLGIGVDHEPGVSGNATTWNIHSDEDWLSIFLGLVMGGKKMFPISTMVGLYHDGVFNLVYNY